MNGSNFEPSQNQMHMLARAIVSVDDFLSHLIIPPVSSKKIQKYNHTYIRVLTRSQRTCFFASIVNFYIVLFTLGASLPIFEQRFNVTRFVRSLNGSLVINNIRNQGGCDEFSAFDEFYSNGLYYFVNVEYDFENKIWKRLGFFIFSNFSTTKSAQETRKQSQRKWIDARNSSERVFNRRLEIEDIHGAISIVIILLLTF